MTVKTTYTPNPAGISDLLRGRQVGEFVDSAAGRVLDSARAKAPVHTGDYKASLDRTAAELDGDTWSAVVYTDDPFWHLIEFGSVNNRPYRTLSQAVTDAGLDFEDR